MTREKTMTREELIQTPEYWRTLYENECERLGIKPIICFSKLLDEKTLDEFALDYATTIQQSSVEDFLCEISTAYKEGYRKSII